MERVRHARIPVHLNAVLIGEKTVPKGCKVRNVSNQGLLLQCDADGRILTFRDGDHVDIHLLFQRPDGTKYLTITAIVRHVDANGIGVEFCQPDAELVKLIESYRIDETQSLEATISPHRKTAGPRRPVKVVTPTASGSSLHAERRQPTKDINGRRLYYFGLLAVAIAIGIITAGYLHTSSLGTRVAALETLIRAHDGEPARIQSPFLTQGDAGGGTDKRKTSQESGSSALSPDYDRPEAIPLQPGVSEPTPSMDTADITASAESAGFPAAGMSREEETAAVTTVEPSGTADQAAASKYVDSDAAENHGPWVINLLSSPNKSDADRFADKAGKLGIQVEQNSIMLKDREFFRVQLTGFLTRKQAEDNAGPIKEKLGLKAVWIFKHGG